MPVTEQVAALHGSYKGDLFERIVQYYTDKNPQSVTQIKQGMEALEMKPEIINGVIDHEIDPYTIKEFEDFIKISKELKEFGEKKFNQVYGITYKSLHNKLLNILAEKDKIANKDKIKQNIEADPDFQSILSQDTEKNELTNDLLYTINSNQGKGKKRNDENVDELETFFDKIKEKFPEFKDHTTDQLKLLLDINDATDLKKLKVSKLALLLGKTVDKLKEEKIIIERKFEDLQTDLAKINKNKKEIEEIDELTKITQQKKYEHLKDKNVVENEFKNFYNKKNNSNALLQKIIKDKKDKKDIESYDKLLSHLKAEKQDKENEFNNHHNKLKKLDTYKQSFDILADHLTRFDDKNDHNREKYIADELENTNAKLEAIKKSNENMSQILALSDYVNKVRSGEGGSVDACIRMMGGDLTDEQQKKILEELHQKLEDYDSTKLDEKAQKLKNEGVNNIISNYPKYKVNLILAALAEKLEKSVNEDSYINALTETTFNDQTHYTTYSNLLLKQTQATIFTNKLFQAAICSDKGHDTQRNQARETLRRESARLQKLEKELEKQKEELEKRNAAEAKKSSDNEHFDAEISGKKYKCNLNGNNISYYNEQTQSLQTYNSNSEGGLSESFNGTMSDSRNYQKDNVLLKRGQVEYLEYIKKGIQGEGKATCFQNVATGFGKTLIAVYAGDITCIPTNQFKNVEGYCHKVGVNITLIDKNNDVLGLNQEGTFTLGDQGNLPKIDALSFATFVNGANEGIDKVRKEISTYKNQLIDLKLINPKTINDKLNIFDSKLKEFKENIDNGKIDQNFKAQTGGLESLFDTLQTNIQSIEGDLKELEDTNNKTKDGYHEEIKLGFERVLIKVLGDNGKITYNEIGLLQNNQYNQLYDDISLRIKKGEKYTQNQGEIDNDLEKIKNNIKNYESCKTNETSIKSYNQLSTQAKALEKPMNGMKHILQEGKYKPENQPKEEEVAKAGGPLDSILGLYRLFASQNPTIISYEGLSNVVNFLDSLKKNESALLKKLSLEEQKMVEKLDASMKQNTIIIDEVGDHIKDENGRKKYAKLAFKMWYNGYPGVGVSATNYEDMTKVFDELLSVITEEGEQQLQKRIAALAEQKNQNIKLNSYQVLMLDMMQYYQTNIATITNNKNNNKKKDVSSPEDEKKNKWNKYLEDKNIVNSSIRTQSFAKTLADGKFSVTIKNDKISDKNQKENEWLKGRLASLSMPNSANRKDNQSKNPANKKDNQSKNPESYQQRRLKYGVAIQIAEILSRRGEKNLQEILKEIESKISGYVYKTNLSAIIATIEHGMANPQYIEQLMKSFNTYDRAKQEAKRQGKSREHIKNNLTLNNHRLEVRKFVNQLNFVTPDPHGLHLFCGLSEEEGKQLLLYKKKILYGVFGNNVVNKIIDQRGKEKLSENIDSCTNQGIMFEVDYVRDKFVDYKKLLSLLKDRINFHSDDSMKENIRLHKEALNTTIENIKSASEAKKGIRVMYVKEGTKNDILSHYEPFNELLEELELSLEALHQIPRSGGDTIDKLKDYVCQIKEGFVECNKNAQNLFTLENGQYIANIDDLKAYMDTNNDLLVQLEGLSKEVSQFVATEETRCDKLLDGLDYTTENGKALQKRIGEIIDQQRKENFDIINEENINSIADSIFKKIIESDFYIPKLINGEAVDGCRLTAVGQNALRINIKDNIRRSLKNERQVLIKNHAGIVKQYDEIKKNHPSIDEYSQRLTFIDYLSDKEQQERVKKLIDEEIFGGVDRSKQSKPLTIATMQSVHNDFAEFLIKKVQDKLKGKNVDVGQIIGDIKLAVMNRNMNLYEGYKAYMTSITDNSLNELKDIFWNVEENKMNDKKFVDLFHEYCNKYKEEKKQAFNDANYLESEVCKESRKCIKNSIGELPPDAMGIKITKEYGATGYSNSHTATINVKLQIPYFMDVYNYLKENGLLEIEEYQKTLLSSIMWNIMDPEGVVNRNQLAQNSGRVTRRESVNAMKNVYNAICKCEHSGKIELTSAMKAQLLQMIDSLPDDTMKKTLKSWVNDSQGESKVNEIINDDRCMDIQRNILFDVCNKYTTDLQHEINNEKFQQNVATHRSLMKNFIDQKDNQNNNVRNM